MLQALLVLQKWLKKCRQCSSPWHIHPKAVPASTARQTIQAASRELPIKQVVPAIIFWTLLNYWLDFLGSPWAEKDTWFGFFMAAAQSHSMTPMWLKLFFTSSPSLSPEGCCFSYRFSGRTTLVVLPHSRNNKLNTTHRVQSFDSCTQKKLHLPFGMADGWTPRGGDVKETQDLEFSSWCRLFPCWADSGVIHISPTHLLWWHLPGVVCLCDNTCAMVTPML